MAGDGHSYDPDMDLRALVVSSDQQAADLLKVILSELELVAEHTASCGDALKRLDHERFDAIILDYRSDGESEEFLRGLRQNTKHKIGVLIAIVDTDFNARPLFGLGANFILYRPLSSERTRVSLRAARGLIRRERRRAPRVTVTATVNVAYPGAPELKAVLQDLSIDGTSITTGNPPPPECKVYFDFTLPGQDQLIRLSGEVAWQDVSGRSGIRFIDVPQSSRRSIQAWLQQSKGQQSSTAFTKRLPSMLPDTKPLVDASGPRTETAIEKKLQFVGTSGNRRDGLRVGCKLGAEVYKHGSRVPHRCALSDISEGGCYVEMPTPMPVQSKVEIVVRTDEAKVRIAGQVLAIHPGFGMGVKFNFRDTAEREDILRLLADLAARLSADELRR